MVWESNCILHERERNLHWYNYDTKFPLEKENTYFEFLLKLLKTEIVSPTAISATSEFKTSGV